MTTHALAILHCAVQATIEQWIDANKSEKPSAAEIISVLGAVAVAVLHEAILNGRIELEDGRFEIETSPHPTEH